MKDCISHLPKSGITRDAVWSGRPRWLFSRSLFNAAGPVPVSCTPDSHSCPFHILAAPPRPQPLLVLGLIKGVLTVCPSACFLVTDEPACGQFLPVGSFPFSPGSGDCTMPDCSLLPMVGTTPGSRSRRVRPIKALTWLSLTPASFFSLGVGRRRSYRPAGCHPTHSCTLQAPARWLLCERQSSLG